MSLSPAPVAGDPSALRRAVIAWWRSGPGAARDRLPWRANRDPWAVLVSETMLAQTTVARVAERFPDFLARYPTAAHLSAAPVGDVLRAWSGLGYNRRAVALHALATRVVADHAGSPPTTLPGLLALPGVGPYTARAVLCFAHDAPVGVVDTNVGRVLARAVAGRRLAVREAQDLADALVPPRRARDWGLALMDLGSLCCRARAPRCGECPLARTRRCVFATRRALDPGTADPAVGSAGTSARQSAFVGSDRQLRGRILRAACAGPLAPTDLAALESGGDAPGRAARLAARLALEGLLVGDGACGYRLP